MADSDIFKRPASTVKRKRVVDEDTYIAELEHIIERDFFPDLKQLKAKKEYKDAVESNDATKLQDIIRKFGIKRIPTSTLRNQPSFDTPQTFETPTSSVLRRPSSASSSASGWSENVPITADDSSSCSGADWNPEKSICPKETDKTLNEYMTVNTSDDNTSFENILDDSEKKRMIRKSWVFNGHNSNKFAMVGGPPSGTNVEMWPFKPMNSLMYTPDGVIEDPNCPGEKNVVVYEKTRLAENPFNVNQSNMDVSEAAEDHRKMKKGKVGFDGEHIVKADQTPRIGGYSFVATPSPHPGAAGDSPLMTWGEIDGTPVRLDDLSSPSPSRRAGFMFQDVDRRDELARILYDKVAKQHNNSKEKGKEVVRKHMAKLTPRFSSERLSNAGRKLLGRTGSLKPWSSPRQSPQLGSTASSNHGNSSRRSTGKRFIGVTSKRSQFATPPCGISRTLIGSPRLDLTDGLMQLSSVRQSSDSSCKTTNSATLVSDNELLVSLSPPTGSPLSNAMT